MRFWVLSLLIAVLLVPSGSIFADGVRGGDLLPVARLTLDGQPAFDYNSMGHPKQYVEKLYTPSGVNILRDSPPDHKHHHGLMLAFTVEGCDFWDERFGKKTGDQRLKSTCVDFKKSRFTSELYWVKYDSVKALFETRSIQAIKLPDVKATVIDWTSVLKCAKGQKKIEISGAHYFGLGMRFVESMDKGGQFFFGGQKGESDLVRGDERVTQANWAAYTAKVDGKPVTVAIFGDPKNQVPMHAFTMGDKSSHFAYLSATLNLYKRSPLEVTKDKPLVLRWCVALWDGQIAPEKIEAAYQAWKARK